MNIWTIQEKRQRSGKIIIVGARGFVGSSLSSHIEINGGTVTKLTSSDINLLDPEAAKKLATFWSKEDTVVLIAALTPDKGKDEATFLKNIQMGVNWGQALKANTPAHVVYISSDAVYSDNASLIDEASPIQPGSYHGMMHAARELILRQTLPPSVPLAILRPCALYGASDTHNSYGPNRFSRTALKDGAITLFGAGEEIRDHLGIGDTVSMIYETIERQGKGVLNLVSGEAISFGDLARKISDLCGRDVKIIETPRSAPGPHRQFECWRMRQAFSDLRMQGLHAGIKDLVGNLRK